METEAICPFEEKEEEIDVLGSRFIASLYPLEEKDDVKKCIERTKERHPKATHYPYAYRLMPFEGMSDEGEPKGSTGIPLLEALRQKKVDRALVVVTRYFGGTKLGLPRLTRTYREALLLAVTNMEEAVFVPTMRVKIKTTYPIYESLKRDASRYGYEISNVIFSISVELDLVGDAKIIASLLDRHQKEIETIAKSEETIRRKKHDQSR